MNRGLKVLGDAGAQDVHKETKHLHDQKVTTPVDPAKISYGSRSAALKYLMLLKIKRDGSIKGRGFTDGWIQRKYTSKEESSSTTMSIESLVISCTIDELGGRKEITVDVPGVFMKNDME